MMTTPIPEAPYNTLISTGTIWKDMLYDSPNPRMINMNLKFNIFIEPYFNDQPTYQVTTRNQQI